MDKYFKKVDKSYINNIDFVYDRPGHDKRYAINASKLKKLGWKQKDNLINDLPQTFQSPTMAPYCADEKKYQVVDQVVNKIKNLKNKNVKIDEMKIKEILTVNGVRFTLSDGSWGHIRASSNKPSLVVVTESPTSEERKKNIFTFIDDLLQKTGEIGDYDQKI